ncbi:MAG: YhdP family protein [Woeseiaceae bacterium]
MRRFLNNLFKFFAYSVAALVILLAIGVGLFRLFLPRLPEYQEQIKDWASQAIGMQVEFSGMDARWGLRGPELQFYEAELLRVETGRRIVAAEQVSVGVALMRLIADRKLVVDRVTVRETVVELRQLENGRWWIQGTPADELLDFPIAGNSGGGDIEVIGEKIELRFLQPGDDRPRFFDIPRFQVRRDEDSITLDGSANLPVELGRDVNVSAIQLLSAAVPQRVWDVTVEVGGLNLQELSSIVLEEKTGFRSGTGDLELSLQYGANAIRSATADIDFQDVSISEGADFEISGRLEYTQHSDGWLLAAQRLSLQSDRGRWPDSDLRIETSINDDGEVVMLDASASYVDLADVGMFLPWVAPERRQQLEAYAADGVVRDLELTLTDLHRSKPRFELSAGLERVGLASVDGWPGVRGFSGSVRANRAGGRLQIDSDEMVVNSDVMFDAPYLIDSTAGTIIWRRSGDSTTILSDSIEVISAAIDSQSNVHVTLPGNGAAPIVDLVSTFAIADVALAKKYIPKNVVKPKLYDWLQNALVSGAIPRGSARLFGALDEFPFDAGDGQLLIQANVRNTILKYRPEWPAVDLIDVDVVVDNVRLYSERGRSSSLGNDVVDAKVEIADLRVPVLSINAFATGTLETVRQFVLQSPITAVFGGQLERVQVEGNASFDLDLTVPLKPAPDFEVLTRLRSNGGRLQVEGFPAPLTDLSGVVSISRDNISGEALGATFLGQPVAIELRSATESEPGLAAVATATGVVTAAAIAEELGVPVAGFVEGASDYQLRVLFPRKEQQPAVPMSFEISSDLVGIEVLLPAPLGKAADDALPLQGDIRLLDGTRIESAGMAGEETAWQVAVTSVDGNWDLDRGVIALGGQPLAAAETRGLHIRGSVDSVRFRDWLELSRGDGENTGAATRVRSIDVFIGDLYILGQHLEDHRVQVDRSAEDWLVQLSGNNVRGSVFVPYDFGGQRPLVVDMQTMHLPGDDESTESGDMPDPRSLPPISLRAADFALGDRHFGAVEAELLKVPDGLVAERMISKDETFEITGSGRWVTDDTDPAGNRTFVTATLNSNNVQQTMYRLGYSPGILGEEMTVSLDLNWSGGPRSDFLDSLSGEVQASFGSGQLDDVEPGAGRVFGLMSVVALPRRLSLDFRDVFDKGFGFDSIEGSFRLQDGEAYTCNLSLSGPAADIGIIGRASLTGRDYQQTAVVSANVGNTLPLVGAVVAGPQAAAVIFLFSQIFKEPLQEVGQVYYAIDGSWDNPTIENANAERFAESGVLAGCLGDSE